MLFAYMWGCVCVCVCVFGDNKASKTDESDYRSPSLSPSLPTAASLKFTFCNHPEVNFEAYPVGLLKLRGRYSILQLHLFPACTAMRVQ